MRYIFINKLKSYIFILFAMILVLITENIFGQSTFSGSGAWSSAARWSAGIPNVGTPVTIAAGSICTVDDPTATCASLTFSTGATITFNVNENLNVAGAITYNSTNNPANQTITVNAGKTLTCSSLTMNATNNDGRDNFLIINGNVDINGNLSMPGTAARNALTLNNGGKLYIAGDFTAGTATFTANATSDVYFDGPGNQAVLGRTYNKLTLMNAGIKTISAATTVNDNLTVSGTASLADGGFQITGAATKIFNVGSGASFTTTRTATPWFPTNMTTPYTFDNNSTINFNGDGSFTLPSTQTTFGHLSFGGASVARIKTLPVTTPFTINGNLTISINNTLADAGNTITVKGNVTNNATHSGTGKIYLNGGSASHTISGGTSTFGNVELDDAVNATWAGTGATSVSGTLTVTSGTLSLGAFTTSFTVSGITNIDGALTNSSVTGSKIFVGRVTLDPSWGGAIWDFSGGNSAVELRGGFEQQNAPTSTFTSGSGTYTFSTNSQSLICDEVMSFDGNIAISGAIQLSVEIASGINVSGTIDGNNANSEWYNFDGTILNYSNSTKPFNTNGKLTVSSASNTVNYSGTNQTICATIGNPYYNLTLSGSGTKTLGAATSIGNDLTINNNIILDLSSYNLTIGSSASTTINGSNTTMILTSGSGYLVKEFTSLPCIFTYKIGTLGSYSPASVNITAPTTLTPTASVAIKANTPNHTSLFDPDDVYGAEKYWDLSVVNLSNITATFDFYYNDNDIPTGADKNNWVGGFYPSGGPWSTAGSSATPGSNQVTFNKVGASAATTNGSYTAAPATAYVAPPNTYWARANGNWTTASTWSTNGCGGVAAGSAPPANSNIYICSGFTVTLDADQTVNNISINGGGVLDAVNKRLTVDGNLIVNGTYTSSGGTQDLNFTGGGTTYIGGTGVFNFTKALKVNGNTSISSTADLSLVKDIDIAAGVTITNNGIVTVNNDITGLNATTSIWINASGSTLSIAGDLLMVGAGGVLTASASGNTVEYTGAVSIKTPSSSTYYNLTVSGATTKTQQAPLILLGNFTIDGGTYASNNNNIEVDGNWTNAGTFTEGIAKVTFNGTSNQTLTCSAGESLYDVEKSNVGTLTLANNLTVTNILTMTLGNIDAGSNRLILTNTASNSLSWIVGSGSIIGEFERYLGASTAFPVIFPVGTSGYERQVVQTFSNNTAGSVISKFVETSPGVLSPRPTADGAWNVYNTYIEGYWSLTGANGLGSTLYNLSLTGNGFTSFPFYSDSTRLFTRPNSGSAWTANGTHSATSGFTANRTGVTTFSGQYCLAYCRSCAVPTTSAITGTSTVCINQTGVVYSVTNTIGSSYLWTVTGGTITAGSGTSSITVTWGVVGTASGNVRVVETNACTQGDPVDFAVVVDPVQPSSITGKTSVPVSTSGEVYSITSRAGYTYTWSISGGTITSPASPPYTGSSVTVTWNASAGYGTISVIASNGCGSAAQKNLSVYKYIVINSIATGDWDVISTWDCACVPLSSDNVRIKPSHTVAVNVPNTTINSVIIDASGTLDNARDDKALEITGDLTVNGTLSNGNQNLTLSGSNTFIDGTGTINFENSKHLDITNGSKTILSTCVLKITASPAITVTFHIHDAGLTVTNNGNFTIGDAPNYGGVLDAAGTSTWVNEANSFLKVSGSVMSTGGSILNASASGNTVNYSGNAAQNIKTPLSSTYYNLICSNSGLKTSLAGLNIDGNLTISDAARFSVATFDISVGGNWSNTSSDLDPFVEGTTTVTFDGVSAQSLACPLAAGETFYNLIINKSNTLTLSNSNITATNALTMSSGNINAGVYTVVLGTNVPFEGALTRTGGTIIGKFKRFITTTGIKLFPVGTATYYRPDTVNLSNKTNGSLTCEFISGDPGSLGLEPDIPDGIVNVADQFTDGKWSLTTADGFSSIAYTTSLTGTGFTSYTIDAATRIIKRLSGGSWAMEGTHVNAVSPICFRTGLTVLAASNTYDFGLAITNCTPFTSNDITGSVNVCKSAVELYSIVPFDVGNTFVWTITDGTSDGSTDENNTVTWNGTWSISAKVRVVESSACYVAPAKEIAVTIHSLPTSAISGPNTAPENTTQGPYSVTARTGYTYTWSVPVGNGTPNPTTGSSINVDWGNASTATLRVVGQYGTCTVAANEDYTVTVYAPITSANNGIWNDVNTWSCTCLPLTTDNIRIQAIHSVTITDASKTVANVTIDGTLTNNAGNNLTVTESYTNNGTHNLGSNNLILNASATLKTFGGTGALNDVADLQFNNFNFSIPVSSTSLTINNTIAGRVYINNGITVSNYGNVTINGTLEAFNNTSTWINKTNSTLIISGDVFQAGGGKGTLTSNESGNTVNYSGTVAQAIKTPSSSTYYNLTTSGNNTVSMAATLTLNGSLSISGTSTFNSANLTLNIKGDWNNISNFTEGSGTVEFNGSGSNQTITNINDETFWNLIINKPSNNFLLSAGTDITISNLLTLTKGVIITGNNFVIIPDGANTDQGSYQSYVDGKVKKVGNEAFVFPVGDGSNYARLAISAPGNATAEFVGQYFASAAPNPANLGSSGIDHVSFVEYWDLARPVGTGPADDVFVTFYWEDGTRSGITDLTDLTLAHYNSGISEWEDMGGATTGTTSAGTLTCTTKWSSFSPTAPASKGGTNPLPIELLNFYAKLVDGNVNLYWTTASEKNNDYFTIEKSINGQDIVEVTQIKGTGNSSVVLNYSTIDENPYTGLSYYRLKQTDFDGKFAYSQWVTISINNINDFSFNVYPNPVFSDQTLFVKLKGFDNNKEVLVVVRDILGNEMYSKVFIVDESDESVFAIDAQNNLKPGVYLIIGSSNNNIYYKKIVIK